MPDVARVRIVEDEPESESASDGSVRSRQAAEVTLPSAELERLWKPEYLERLGRTYWLYLSRVSLGLLRVIYTQASRSVVLLIRPLVLIRFHAPEYELGGDRGTISWRIERGLLVAPRGRERGFLRLSVKRPAEAPGEDATVRVVAEVENFYPSIAGPGVRGLLGRVMRAFYRLTQLRLHVLVTHGFLRSLSRLELPRSVVRALEPDDSVSRWLPSRRARR